ncbi:MAG: cytidylate kinase family protein [Candidatus Aenigmarchaeota archaeon]|nr:cytidylate kinase family protein [Candidatus Aenigmarchaeota archaeon]
MPVIAIAGQPTAGSSIVAKLLAKKLKLKHFSAGDYFKKKAKSVSKKGRTDAKGVNPLTKRTTEFLRDSTGGSQSFHNKLDELQKKNAKKGRVVIDSKLAIKMLAEYADLKIWVKCDKKIRAERIAGREDISIKEAEKILEEREKTERSVFKRIYGFDTFDQEKDADLVIDSTNKTPEQIVDEIVAAYKSRSNKR